MRIKDKILIDQYGQIFKGNSLKELKENYGLIGSISKMYRDSKKMGVTLHVGYVIGNHWLTVYQPVEMIA